MLKRTALYHAHQELGARLIDFGGWEMPVLYTSIVDEHHAVRNNIGIFDIAHMGQVLISGPGALHFLNWALTNDARRLDVGQGQYTLMCNHHGGVVDDLYLYRTAETDYLLIVNASRAQVDLDWLMQQRQPAHNDFTIRDLFTTHGALAIQGPSVSRLVHACLATNPTQAQLLSNLRKNEIAHTRFQDAPIHIARTGYTGEDGFECFVPVPQLPLLWRQLLETGRPHGIKPCGLGARDTLRTEMGYPLYGHELDENTTPLEAGLGIFVALDKPNFIGREPLIRQKSQGIPRKCVAFVMAEPSPPPRPGYPIWPTQPASEPFGIVVSGTQSPSLGIGIGLGYVPPDQAKPGCTLHIEIRAKRYNATIVKKPIYRRPTNSLLAG